MCQNLPPGDFFFVGAEKIRLIQLFVNLPTSVFFFPAKNKTKKRQYITGWFDCIQVWRVYTQGNYL